MLASIRPVPTRLSAPASARSTAILVWLIRLMAAGKRPQDLPDNLRRDVGMLVTPPDNRHPDWRF